ncbi:hypothetical protein P3L10_028336 [Capsicum annuum]
MEAQKECCANMVVYLHPSKAKKVESSVYCQLSSLLFKFNESLDGVVLTYEPKFSSNLAKILPGIHPYFGMRFEAKLLLFHPKPDMLLEDEVIREDFKYKIKHGTEVLSADLTRNTGSKWELLYDSQSRILMKRYYLYVGH